MNLPNKVYYPEFDYGYRTVSCFPRENSKENSLIDIKLPVWLSDLIKKELQDVKREAVKEFKKEVCKIFDL